MLELSGLKQQKSKHLKLKLRPKLPQLRVRFIKFQRSKLLNKKQLNQWHKK
jgi:hypothetical protein